MRCVWVLVLLCVMTGVAAAQPGTTQPEPPPPAQPYPPQPQPQPYYAQPYYPQPQYHLLTDEERELIADGEIEPPQHIIGGVAGTFLGLGIGHAVQGRWGEKGWIFTVGEVAAFSLIIVSLGDCAFGQESCDDEADGAVLGLFAFVGLRIWEAFDVWFGPRSHNRRVRAAQMKAGLRPPTYGLYLAPPLTHDEGGVAGLTLRF